MKWYNIKTQKIFKEGDFVPTQEADYLVELVPVVTGCDWGKKDIDKQNE